MISLPRLSLGAAGLVFLALGILFLYDATLIQKLFKIPLPAAVMRAELTTMYGGLQTGLGLFFLGAAGHTRWIRAALAAQVAVFTGLAGGRVIGMVMHGYTSTLFMVLLTLELGGLLIGLMAFHRAKVMMTEYAARGLL
jgi:hypothetical protein